MDFFSNVDIADILRDSIIVVGTIEFIKNIMAKKKFCKFAIWQVLLCFLFSINHTIGNADFTLSVISIVQIVCGSVTLIAGSTLAYDLVVDKFKLKKE